MLNILKTISTASDSDVHNTITLIQSEIGMPACRICYDTSGNPIEPCNCRGSIGNVHLHCLEKWLSDKRSTKCEICLFEYKVEWVPKYNLVQSLAVWTHQQLTKKDLFHIILLVALILTIIGTAAFVLPQVKSQFLFFMCIIDGLLSVCTFIYLLWKTYKKWFSWWDSQTRISLPIGEED